MKRHKKWETWLTVKSVRWLPETEDHSCPKAKLGMRMVAAQHRTKVRFPPKSRVSVMDEFVQWPPPPASISGQGGEDKVRGGSKDVENKEQEHSLCISCTLVWEI